MSNYQRVTTLWVELYPPNTAEKIADWMWRTRIGDVPVHRITLSCRLDDRKLVYLFPIYQDDLYQVDINCWYICSYELDDLPQNISLKLVDCLKPVSTGWLSMIASELPQKALRNPTVRPRGFQTEVLQHLHSQSLCRCLLATSLDEASLDEKTENYVPKPVFSIHHPQKSPFLRVFSPQMVNIFLGHFVWLGQTWQYSIVYTS